MTLEALWINNELKPSLNAKDEYKSRAYGHYDLISLGSVFDF